MQGQVIVLHPPRFPCLRCLLPELPDASDETSAIVGAASGLVGSVQALEAVKYLVGMDTALAGTLLLIDAQEMRFQSVDIRRRPSCPECGLL